MFLGMFAREERERKDCDRGSVSVSNSYTFVCLFVSVSKRQKRGRRVLVLRKLLTCRLEETTPFGDHFPPKSPTRHRFRDHFPPKAQHGTILGIYISPQKPTRRRFGDQLSHQIFHVGPAHSFCLFWFLYYFGLVWFKWINGFGLFFNLR